MKIYTDEELAAILDKRIFHEIGDIADDMNLECYVVGGYVRDLFLERPSKDIDIVVVGSGISIAEALKKKLGRKAHLAVFRNFGTAQVNFKGYEGAEERGYEIELIVTSWQSDMFVVMLSISLQVLFVHHFTKEIQV